MGARAVKIELTDEQKSKVLITLRLGGTCTDAANEIGMPPKRLKRFCAENLDFEREAAMAQSHGKMRHIRKIYKADDWRASAWWLGIRYQAEFGNPSNPPSKAGNRGGIGLEAESLIRLKRQLANLLRNNGAENLVEQVCEIVDGTSDPEEVTKVVLDLGDGAVTKA